MDTDQDDDFEDDDDVWACWKCHGVGGFHDCGEATCCCLDPADESSDDWIVCDECDGWGES
jgi:hypothetical protein